MRLYVRRMSRKNVLLLLQTSGLLCLSHILAGCGGAGNTASTGRAALSIVWPSNTSTGSRLIPVAANSITVAFKQSGSVIATQTVARPSSGSTSSIAFDTLPVGTLSLTAQAFPTTDGSGVAQASATSSASITAGQTTAVTLTMASTISQLALTPASPAVTAGATVQLAVTAYDASNAVVLTSASTLTWASATTGVATVSSTGLVTAVAAGTSQITATESESGKTASVTVTVTPITGGANVTVQ